MMLKLITRLFVVLVVASVAVAQSAIDYNYYCSSDYDCSTSGSHVMCSYPVDFTSNCNNAEFIPTTDARRALFVDGHNTRRNTAALGQLTGSFAGKSATRMAEMTWDDELEMFAQKQLINCSLTHDDCHKSLKFNYPGQNTAFQCSTPIVSPEEAIQSAIAQWWDENMVITSINGNNDFSSIQASSTYDHFTQMAHDNAYKLGCATVSTDAGNCYYITCNYAITNWNSDPVYAVGTARSSCQTQSSTYSGLCGQNEDYTGYTTNGISFFTTDQTVPNAVTQFINNGRVLFGASDSSTVTSTDTQTTTQISTVTDSGVSGDGSAGSSSGPVQSNNQTDPTSGSLPNAADTGSILGYLIICKDKNNCKKSTKKEKKSKHHKKQRKHKKKKSCKKNKSCKSSGSRNKTKKIKYHEASSRKKRTSHKH